MYLNIDADCFMHVIMIYIYMFDISELETLDCDVIFS